MLKPNANRTNPKRFRIPDDVLEIRLLCGVYFLGEQYRDGRDIWLLNLWDLHEDTPELFFGVLVVNWEAFAYGYLDKSFGGMRRSGRFCRPADGIDEITRLA